MLQLIIAGLILYIAYLLTVQHEVVDRGKSLEKKLKEVEKELKKYKEYERSYKNLKQSYLDLLDKAVGEKNKKV